MRFLTSIKWKEIPVATYVRYVLMLLTIVNTILTRCGLNPITASEEEVYQIVSDILTIAILIANTWCNNSVTAAALSADTYMKGLKSKNK